LSGGCSKIADFAFAGCGWGWGVVGAGRFAPEKLGSMLFSNNL
jgi:hypothetical protein